MAESSTFRQLLAQTSESVERPKPLPEGHYLGSIKSYAFGQSRKKQTAFVEFTYTLEEAQEDVDQTQLEGINLANKEIKSTFYLTPGSIYRLSDFLDAVLGVQSGRTMDERVPETRGTRVQIHVTQRPSEDGKTIYNDIGTVVGVDQAAEQQQAA